MSNTFMSGADDYMFPTTLAGMREAGLIFESAGLEAKINGNDFVFESAIDKYAQNEARAKAMSAVLSWIEDGSFDYNSLDETIVVVADIDGNYELGEDEENLYSEIWNQIPDALLTLGAEIEDVQEFVDGPGTNADKAAIRIGKTISDAMEEMEAEDDALIASFAFGEDAILESSSYDNTLHGILEATFKKRKVVRDGKVQVVKKRVSGKVRLSAAQKAGLKKARRKAHNAAANLARKKSLKIRANRGL